MPPQRGRGRGRGRIPRQQNDFPPDQREARPPRQQGAEGFPTPYVQQQTPSTSREVTHAEAPLHQGAHSQSIDPKTESESKKEKPTNVSPTDVGLEVVFKKKVTISPPFPKNPGPGKLGRRIRLISNCYKIDIPDGYIYHYDVEVLNTKYSQSETTGPVKDRKYACKDTKRNREIINLMLQTYDQFSGVHPVYDGRKNLYTRNPLQIADGSCLQFDIVMKEREEAKQSTDTYQVTITSTKKENTNSCAINLEPLHEFFEGRAIEVPQEAIMAIETILRHGPCLRYIPVGRSFFFPDRDGSQPLDAGKEIWSGYHQSVRIGQWPMVNIDLSATTFYKAGPVIDFITEIIDSNREALRRIPNLNDNQRVTLSRKLKNLKVETRHLGYRRKYRVIKLCRENASQLEFSLTVNDQNVRKNVKDYFKEQYNTILQYPNLSCLQVEPEKKKIYLPLEICDILEGQHCKEKLTMAETAEMIKFTTRPPHERFAKIDDIVHEANFDSDEVVRSFDLHVSDRPLVVEDARVLEPPNILYDEKQIKPRNGTWNMRDTMLYAGADIQNWVLLSFSYPDNCNINDLNKFSGMLCNIARKSGLFINRPMHTEIMSFNRENIQRVLNHMKKKYNAELAVIVLPFGDKDIYNNVKKTAETILGLKTQCITDANVKNNCKPALLSNLCLKINTKMGGTNNTLNPGETPRILDKPVIIFGADVSHPGAFRTKKPSIAAVVGSLYKNLSRYAVTCKVQTNIDEEKKSVEIIKELKDMVKDLLIAFYRSTAKKPEKIIFYRDGVSEGQFKKVRKHEVECIRQACRELGNDYQPGITFIIVQKGHHVRFITQDPRQAVKNNVPPGTTVDTVITHPMNFDFFLCSQLGIQGTSRPCYYTVIEDDNQFTADDLQKLSYYLCHLNVRCTKSVSIPAPVAYAHLAAYRANQYLSANLEESSRSSNDSSEASFQGFPAALEKSIQVLDVMKNTMYFV